MALEATRTAPRAAGLDAAHRAVRAAALATAAGHDRLPWATLRAWPEWAWVDGDAPAQSHPPSQTHGNRTTPPPWLLTLGALRDAAVWQQCIDGRCLQALRSLIGTVAFDAVMQQPLLPAPGAPAAVWSLALQASSGSALATALLAAGRDVAAAAIGDPALQAAVMAVLNGHSSPAARKPDAASTTNPSLSAASALALQRQAMDLHPISAEGQR